MLNFVWTFYEDIGNRNASAGLHILFIYVNDVTAGMFINLLLFGIFMIFALSTYFISRERIGTGDLPMSFALASFITVIIALLLKMIKTTGNYALVSNATLGILIALTGIFVLWFMFSRD